jgi:hypothetical protein
MFDQKDFRMKGFALIGSGLSIALFWLLVLPFESFAGPDVPLHSLFVPGQIFHILGAILAVFGYFGIYMYQKESAGNLGKTAFILAVIGMMFFLADAMIGILVFPELARHAPEMTSATGPLFTGRALGFYIMFAATNMIGIVLLGISMLRTKKFTTLAASLFIVGGIMFNLPPSPTLHLVLVAGGVIWGVGAILLGRTLMSKS